MRLSRAKRTTDVGPGSVIFKENQLKPKYQEKYPVVSKCSGDGCIERINCLRYVVNVHPPHKPITVKNPASCDFYIDLKEIEDRIENKNPVIESRKRLSK